MMTQDSKLYLFFLQGIGVGACGGFLHPYAAFGAVIVAVIAFIWNCLDAQDDKGADAGKTFEKGTQAPDLFTKYQKILNEEEETKLRQSLAFSAKDIAKFNRLLQPEKYPNPDDMDSGEEQDVEQVYVKKEWNPYRKRQSLCPAGTSREYLPMRRSSVPVPPSIVVSSPPAKERKAHIVLHVKSPRAPSPVLEQEESSSSSVTSIRKKDLVLTVV